MSGLLQIVREADLQATIEEMCDWAGLLHFHDEDARRDDAGFLDLVIVNPPTLHIWELKTMQGRVSPVQAKWIHALQHCVNIDCGVIRPSDLPYVRQTLGFGKE